MTKDQGASGPLGPATADMDRAQLRAELDRLVQENHELRAALAQRQRDHDLAQRAAREIIWDFSAETGRFNASLPAWQKLGLVEGSHQRSMEEWLQVIHPDDRERYRAEIAAFLRSGEEILDQEYRIHAKDGGYRWVEVRALALRDEKGRVYRMVGSLGDVSARKRAEQGLKVAKETAEAMSRSKSEFLANMSHELRTPLNAIIGFSEMMSGELFGPLGNEHYREYAASIHDSGTHLLSLINDVLDLSKIEAGKFELHEEAVDLVAVAASALNLVKQRAANGRTRLVNRVPRGLPGLWADERALKQILLNLLSNAIKFTPEGGEVALGAAFDGPDGMCIHVQDTGIGIAAEAIPKVLEPFGQVDDPMTRDHEGTGLGLPLVKSLVELHGGVLSIESAVGEGTTVSVRLPAARVLSDPGLDANGAA